MTLQLTGEEIDLFEALIRYPHLVDERKAYEIVSKFYGKLDQKYGGRVEYPKQEQRFYWPLTDNQIKAGVWLDEAIPSTAEMENSYRSIFSKDPE